MFINSSIQIIFKLIIIINVVIEYGSCKEITVDTKSGSMIGRVDIDQNKQKFFSFQGIPYAQPPVGNLRFKAPEPVSNWAGKLNATKEGAVCPQLLLNNTLLGDENCLFLNIYTPSIDSSSLKNVIVWIHGGSFVEGSGNSDIHGPKYLVTEDVILVTLNYRLGVLGFLSLNDTKLNATGNAALKDQLMALKWIQANIEAFGGNPKKITIGGNSAGAVSVDLHVVSKQSTNLFQRAIVQSGCGTAFWSMGVQFARDLAEILENPKNNSDQEILEFLNGIPAKNLIQAQIKLSGVQNVQMKIGPVIEPGDSYQPFLTKLPKEAIENGEFSNVPYMIGFTSQEAMYHSLYLAANLESVPETTSDFEKLLPPDMHLTAGSTKSKKIADKVKEFYYKNEKPSMNNVEIFFSINTDIGFVIPINHQVKLLSKKILENNLFYYLFALDGELNLFKTSPDFKALHTNYSGAAHTDEKGYLFNNYYAPKIDKGSDTEKYLNRMLKLWTNFAAFGNPNGITARDPVLNVAWKSVTQNTSNYLEINKELIPGVDPFKERIKFWEQMYLEANGSNYFKVNFSLLTFVSLFIIGRNVN